ncbi:MAG: alcohol dehydrogenase catalytic domain-containing protein [Burkholderiales bacterium]|nr:alcohol dehydrogenase catalytic domain-containing protein [Burkholderiales bacterium]
MEKFKVYRLREADKRVVAGFEEATIDELDPGEVVVRVAYSSVNYKDALAATGKGRIIRRFPCIGGIDLAGTVVGSGDARFTKGDAVIATSYDIGVAHDGGFAEYARVPADWVVPMPKGMTLKDAMALGTAGFTAGLAVARMEHEGAAPGQGAGDRERRDRRRRQHRNRHPRRAGAPGGRAHRQGGRSRLPEVAGRGRGLGAREPGPREDQAA